MILLLAHGLSNPKHPHFVCLLIRHLPSCPSAFGPSSRLPPNLVQISCLPSSFASPSRGRGSLAGLCGFALLMPSQQHPYRTREELVETHRGSHLARYCCCRCGASLLVVVRRLVAFASRLLHGCETGSHVASGKACQRSQGCHDLHFGRLLYAWWYRH